MAEQFKDQGGLATSDPNPFLRWLASRIISHLCSPKRLEKRRQKVERSRQKSGQPHVVEYFHQVDDGYSHLAAQVLQRFADRYDVEVVCHLVRGPEGKNVAEPELLLQLSRYDAFHVAPAYGLDFPEHPHAPDPAHLALAAGILAALDNKGFIEHAAEVGDALWSGDKAGLDALAARLGCATDEERQARVAAGTERQAELKHYSGAMFYYGQEWYWGVDRL